MNGIAFEVNNSTVICESMYDGSMLRIIIRLTFCWMLVLPSIVVLSTSLHAQEEIENIPTPIPNLTVTVNLNSGLNTQETIYYKKIVEEMLRAFPTKVELNGEYQNMIRKGKELDHINIVAYLPSVDNDSGLDKDIRFMKIPFEFPTALKTVKSEDDLRLAGESTIVLHNTPYEDFMRRVHKERGEIESGSSVSALSGVNTESVTGEKVKPVMAKDFFSDELAKIVASGKVDEGSENLNKGATPPVMVKESLFEKIKNKKAVDVDSVKNVAIGKAPKVLRLAYFGDSMEPQQEGDSKLKEFVKKFKKSGRGSLSLVFHSLPTFDGTAKEMSNKRFEVLKKSLEREGLEEEKIMYSKIFLISKGRQSIEIDAGL